MADSKLLLADLLFPESPRWHDDRLWLADWAAQQIIAVDAQGNSEVVEHVASFPFSIDWLPDGRLTVISAADRGCCAKARMVRWHLTSTSAPFRSGRGMRSWSTAVATPT